MDRQSLQGLRLCDMFGVLPGRLVTGAVRA